MWKNMNLFPNTFKADNFNNTLCFAGCIVMSTLYVTLLLWKPNMSEQYILYILATMFGISRYVNEPLIAGL